MATRRLTEESNESVWSIFTLNNYLTWHAWTSAIVRAIVTTSIAIISITVSIIAATVSIISIAVSIISAAVAIVPITVSVTISVIVISIAIRAFNYALLLANQEKIKSLRLKLFDEWIWCETSKLVGLAGMGMMQPIHVDARNVVATRQEWTEFRKRRLEQLVWVCRLRRLVRTDRNSLDRDAGGARVCCRTGCNRERRLEVNFQLSRALGIFKGTYSFHRVLVVDSWRLDNRPKERSGDAMVGSCCGMFCGRENNVQRCTLPGWRGWPLPSSWRL